MARYDNVIVGGGLAGGMVAQELAERGAAGSTLIIAGEQHPPYHRPPLTKEFLRGEKPESELYMHPAEWWAEHGVELRQGVRATRLLPEEHAVELADGDARLLRPAGPRNRVDPPAAGRHPADPHHRGLAAGGQAAGAGRRGHLAVIGGGFIGVEAAASARMKGLDVTLAMQNAVVWDHLFGAEVGRYFQRHLEEHGVRLLTERSGLPDDLEPDAVVAGIGVDPNTDLARDAGLAVGGGVLCDGHLKAADDIWVAGDIAEYESVVHGRRIRIEHWDVALNQGGYIGRTWAGDESGPYDVVPYFFSDLADWTWMEYVGPGSPDDEVDVRGSMADDDFVAYYTDATAG